MEVGVSQKTDAEFLRNDKQNYEGCRCRRMGLLGQATKSHGEIWSPRVRAGSGGGGLDFRGVLGDEVFEGGFTHGDS